MYTVIESTLLDSLHRIDSLVNIYKYTNSARAIQIARRGQQLPNVHNFPSSSIKANLITGIAYLNKQNDSSFYYFSKAQNLADEYKIDSLKAAILYNLSKIYVSALDYKMGIILLDSVIKLAYMGNDYPLISNAFNDLGILKDDSHDSASARIMYDSAYRIALRHSLTKQMGVAIGNLAKLEKDNSRSLRLQKNAVELLKKFAGTETAISLLYINIGNRFEEADSSMKYYQSAISILDPETSSEVALMAYNNLAYSYIDKKEFGKAEHCLTLEAIPLAERWMNLDWLATLNDTYSDVLIAEGNLHESALAEKKAYKLRGQAYDFKVTGQLRLLSVLLDVKNKEISLKSKDQELQKKSNRIRLLLFTFILFAVFTGFTVFWVIQRNKLSAERQRFSSANKIIELEESLKGRLAMELHDMTSPLYTSLLRQIEEVAIPNKTVKDELHSSLTMLADRIRKISHEMAGGFYEDLTFNELIQGLCEEMQYRTDAQILLYLDKNNKSFSPERSQQTLRIVQELMTNAVKYVKIGKINIKIKVESGNLKIIYFDDGTGFDVKEKNKTGLGLTNIFERTKLLGGTANLESGPAIGTHWKIEIPMEI